MHIKILLIFFSFFHSRLMGRHLKEKIKECRKRQKKEKKEKKKISVTRLAKHCSGTQTDTSELIDTQSSTSKSTVSGRCISCNSGSSLASSTSTRSPFSLSSQSSSSGSIKLVRPNAQAKRNSVSSEWDLDTILQNDPLVVRFEEYKLLKRRLQQIKKQPY